MKKSNVYKYMDIIQDYLKNTDNFILKYCYLMPLLAILPAIYLYSFPIQIFALIATIPPLLLIIFVTRIFLVEEILFTHGKGVWLGFAAVLSVTSLFGASYNYLLLERFPNKQHFSFTANTDSDLILNRWYASNQLLIIRHVLDKAIKVAESCEAKMEKGCGPSMPKWSNQDILRVKHALGRSIYSTDGNNALDMNGVKALLVSHAIEKMSLEVDQQEGSFQILTSYLNPLLVNIGRHIQSNNFNVIFDPNLAGSAFTVDMMSQNIYPKDINRIIVDTVDCLSGKDTEFCSVKDGDEPLKGDRYKNEFPPSGSSTLGRYILSEFIIESIDSSTTYDLSTLVFDGYLFSALTLMTSGHADMNARSNTARILLFLEFMAFVLILLLVIPVGLKPKSNN